MKNKIITDIFILIFIGALSSLSLPPFNYFFINFFTFSILFIFLFKNLNIQSTKKIYFFYGWLFGFGYFLTNTYWITISLTFDQNFKFLIPFAVILIPALLAIFYGFVTFIFFLFNFKNVLSAFFLFFLFFGFIEYFRGNILTGFPWNLIIYSFSENINFLSFLSLIGTYSLNLIVITFFSAPAIYILRKSKKDIVTLILILSLPLIFSLYGLFYKQKFLDSEIKTNPYLIRVIGSNISLDRFLNDINRDNVIEELIGISSPNTNKKIFFLWPEGILPDIYQDELNLYKNLFSRSFSENHILGMGITSRLLNKKKYEYFNSLVILDNNLNIINNYNKINLVPFGEFLPLEKILNKIGLKTITNNFGSFTRGDNREIIKIGTNRDSFKFIPLICYEIIYSGNLIKNFDFDFIFNISEDGWFGKSIGPKQHFTHSKFRAIENGKYVIRSSNNGMTAIINPLGEIEKKLDYGKAGYIDFVNRRDIDKTFFSKYGNKIFILLILLYIFLIFSFNKMKNE